MIARQLFYGISVVLTAVLLLLGATHSSGWFWGFAILVPLILLGLRDITQTTQSLRRNYPVIGHARYLLEAFRPEIQQYFVETNWQGRPFDREFRSIIYQRAKGVNDTTPFGTQRDVYSVGYEWMSHSLAPLDTPTQEPREPIGGKHCTQPYEASHLNVSAMSYGSLSANAVRALNGAAKTGGFYHNTGEGGVSPYHLEAGGDLVWQVGTGYFGCRSKTGGFDPESFAESAGHASVKMIELKLSQGAKPGHGGILPAAKVTEEISRIRRVPMGEDVISPPAHREFATPLGLIEFVARLRDLSGGKPVGIKLCVGSPVELMAIIKACLEVGTAPDFIAVDGGEGGTGAAPLEFSNSVGTPLREGLVFVRNALVGAGLKDQVKIVASGKIASGFHMIRALALGADVCASARGMMFALGCIQARRCNSNDCPVGVATQNLSLARGLVPADKAQRVARYHHETIHAFLHLLAAGGFSHPDELGPQHVMRRVAATDVRTLSQVYPFVDKGSLLDGSAPAGLLGTWDAADSTRFGF